MREGREVEFSHLKCFAAIFSVSCELIVTDPFDCALSRINGRHCDCLKRAFVLLKDLKTFEAAQIRNFSGITCCVELLLLANKRVEMMATVESLEDVHSWIS